MKKQRTEMRAQGTSAQEQKSEDRGQSGRAQVHKSTSAAENREQRTENREQRTEDRGQGPGDRGQRSEVRGQGKTPHLSPSSSIHYLLFAIHYLLFAIHYSLFAVCYPLFSIRYSLTSHLSPPSSIRYLLFAICYSTFYLLASTFYLLPAVYGAFESAHITSPRILSMGGAGAALSNDAAAVNINPAGLVQIEKSELNASYSNIYNADGLFRGYIAYAAAPESNGIGVSWSRLSLPGIYAEDIFAFAVARQLSDEVAAGLSIKIFSNEVIGSEYDFYGKRKYAAGYDIGILYQFTSDWIAGILYENLNEPAISSEDKKLKSSLKIGIRFHPFESGVIVADFDIRRNAYFAGFETIIGKVFCVRIGMNDLRPTFGCGITYGLFTFDLGLLSDNNLGFLTQAGVRIRI